jgi:hypothetical protein
MLRIFNEIHGKYSTSLGNACNTHHNIHIRKVKGEIFVNSFLYFTFLFKQQLSNFLS